MEVGDGGLGGAFPVCVEVAPCGVEEDHAGQVVGRVERGEERVGQGVGGEDVQGAAQDECWGVGVAVHQLAQRRAHRGCRVEGAWRSG